MANLKQMPNSLPSGYESWWAEVAGHLGGIYPFQDCAAPETFSLNIGAIIEARRARGEAVTLDPIGLVGKTALPFLLGNRTLLQGVQRAPWMTFPSGALTWQAAPLPEHGQERPDPDQFVESLKKALLDEGRQYVGKTRTVGILLSGGMDSRVLAGVVKALQEESAGKFTVVGLTWGDDRSRDVIYARRIVERFRWDWRHFPITVEKLRHNITQVARIGAEVSPLHLHAIPEVAQLEGVDVILAGSYGDSVGRAEFSGRHVTKLRPILPRHFNRFGVLRSEGVKRGYRALLKDGRDSPHLNENTATLRQREIEQEMHYMRRMLQSCMCIIGEQKRFYQLFTAPRVVEKMWSVDPALRDDDWYRRLLPLLPGNLLDIPWARTGRRYDRPDDSPDEYSSRYHYYGTWLRHDLRDEVLGRINSDRIRNLGLFNDKALNRALKSWQRPRPLNNNPLDELVSWIAGLHNFLEYYDIENKSPPFSSGWRDKRNAMTGGLFSIAYIELRERMKP